MNTKDFHFTQEQQNIIGRALLNFAEVYTWDGLATREIGSAKLSELLEDFVGEVDIAEVTHISFSDHTNIVKHLRALMNGVFDPTVMPALEVNSTRLTEQKKAA